MAVRTEVGDRRFIYQFLSTRRAQFKALASGNLIPGLSRGDILGMAAYFPSRDEQQKIADCLGSLDDLIVAEGRKLEALRQHKQGLMQQLFPRHGETVPRLRFPEFRSAGDWHFQPLSDIAEPISERVGTSKCVPLSVTTGVGLLAQEEKFGRTIAGNSYKNYIRLQTNDFAYNKSATKEFPQGYIARYSGTIDAAVPTSIFKCFRPDAAAVIPEYLDHLLHGNHHGRWLRKYITVGARAHGALSVSDDGVMAIILPHGVLFRGGAEAKIRGKLLDDGHIDTVIGLPANLFYSTGIPVCILVLKKCKKPDDVLFINASEHFEKGKRQNYLSDEHIEKIIATYQQRPESIERYARRVGMDEIEDNDFNLNISRYVSTAKQEVAIDLSVTHKELVEIEKQIQESTAKHNAFLKELGLSPLPAPNK